MADWNQSRIEAVARAVARVRYPLAAEPAPQDIDFREAERFVAMMDADLEFTLPDEASESWADEVARLQREIGDRQARLHDLVLGNESPGLAVTDGNGAFHPIVWADSLAAHEREAAGDC